MVERIQTEDTKMMVFMDPTLQCPKQQRKMISHCDLHLPIPLDGLSLLIS